jgi:hypothetical protein
MLVGPSDVSEDSPVSSTVASVNVVPIVPFSGRLCSDSASSVTLLYFNVPDCTIQPGVSPLLFVFKMLLVIRGRLPWRLCAASSLN